MKYNIINRSVYYNIFERTPVCARAVYRPACWGRRRSSSRSGAASAFLYALSSPPPPEDVMNRFNWIPIDTNNDSVCPVRFNPV